MPWVEEKYAQVLGVQRALAAYEKHPGFSGVCDGYFVAAAGIVIPYPGVGEGWAIAGPLVRTHLTFFHRTIKTSLVSLARSLKLRRLQVMVRAEFETSQNWVTRLGFHLEGRMRQFGIDGDDMLMYAMFPNEVNDAG